MPQQASPTTVKRTERRRQAFALRMGGATYVEIAGAMGISRQAAHQLVKWTLEDTRTKLFEDIESVRALEVRRTEALVLGLWPNRQQPRYADSILRIMERRARLLGLDAPTRIDERVQGVVRFEVVTGIEGQPGDGGVVELDGPPTIALPAHDDSSPDAT
jgi:hypothetical protein